MTTPLVRALTLIGVGTLVVSAMSPALADSDTEQTAEVEVIASGLNNPRGLTFRHDGGLYVAEAGTGGSGPCFPGPEGSPVCFGLSGSVTRIDHRGQTRVLTELPSIGDEGSGEGAIGPSDVSFKRQGGLFITLGLGLDLDFSSTIPELDVMGKLLRARAQIGEWQPVADLTAFEDANNPTGDEENVNPNSVISLRGRSVVADAGANDLLQVKPGGRISTLATFADRLVDAPPFLGLPPGTQIPMDAVPTSVAQGPDGALYVGQLTGFPFPVGGANVYRVAPGEDPEVVASGFTNIIDVAFDEHGTMYVLEIFHNGLLSGDPTGALIRVDDTGGQEILMTDGLITPGGLALRDGYAYVSNCGTCPGAGEVLQIPLS